MYDIPRVMGDVSFEGMVGVSWSLGNVYNSPGVMGGKSLEGMTGVSWSWGNV